MGTLIPVDLWTGFLQEGQVLEVRSQNSIQGRQKLCPHSNMDGGLGSSRQIGHSNNPLRSNPTLDIFFARSMLVLFAGELTINIDNKFYPGYIYPGFIQGL